MSELKKEVAQMDEKQAIALFSELKKEELQSFGISPARFSQEVKYARQLFVKDKNLKRCSAKDILNVCFDVCAVGLTLNPLLKHAYLVSRWDSQQGKQMPEYMPSYMGLEAKAMETGKIAGFKSSVVYEGEEFSVIDGINSDVRHIKTFGDGKPRKVIGAYSIAYFNNTNMRPVVEVMDINEIYGIRERSDGYKAFKAGKIRSCPWVSDEPEMCRKTVIKRQIKHLNLGESVARVIEADNREYVASDGQIKFIEKLLDTKAINDEEVAAIERTMYDNLSSIEAGEIITRLKSMDDKESFSSAGDAKRMLKAALDNPKK